MTSPPLPPCGGRVAEGRGEVRRTSTSREPLAPVAAPTPAIWPIDRSQVRVPQDAVALGQLRGFRSAGPAHGCWDQRLIRTDPNTGQRQLARFPRYLRVFCPAYAKRTRQTTTAAHATTTMVKQTRTPIQYAVSSRSLMLTSRMELAEAGGWWPVRIRRRGREGRYTVRPLREQVPRDRAERVRADHLAADHLAGIERHPEVP